MATYFLSDYNLEGFGKGHQRIERKRIGRSDCPPSKNNSRDSETT